MNIDESKQEFRAQMQEQLQMLDAEDRRGRSLKICNRVFELPVWKRAQVVVIFEPFSYEPEIAPLIADLRRRGSEIITILPTARSQHDVAIFAPIDCGGQRNYEHTLKSFLHSRGINRIEGILLTHGDAQHIDGAADTVADFAPREIYNNPLDVRSAVQRRLSDALQPGKIKPRALIRGDSLLFGRNVHAEILYPKPNIKITAADDAPLILHLVFDEEIRVLFESDAGATAEASLLETGDNLQSDILIKGQHYSGGSGTPRFLEAVKPKLIIATSRESPVAEQITQEWANEIAQRGITLFRQDQTRAIEVQFGNEEWTARAYLTGETFRSSSR